MGATHPSELKKVIYGPVPSWRLRRSLGVDLLSRPKTCSFDCTYCQLGPTRHKLTRRQEFVPTSRVIAELEALREVAVDFVTFSGMGEPTLASNLGEAIVEASARIRAPVAVLTNSSLIADPAVRAELALADFVVAKLDAPDEDLFRRVNRPAQGITLQAVVEGLRQFRRQHQGRLAAQVMFYQDNQDRASEIAALVSSLHPDEVQVNTPLRPCPVKPLPAPELAEIARAFEGLNVMTAYDPSRPAVQALDTAETASRRPR